MRAAVLAGLVLALAPAANAQSPIDAAAEVRNLAIGQQRREAWSSPAAIAAVGEGVAAYQARRRAAIDADPERAPDLNSCTFVVFCPVDPRLDGWAERGGIVRAVLFTARSGATLSGHVWARPEGPSRRPGVLFVNGSIAGYEESYWFIAQALASNGYLVMTFDAQGEGMSDQFGERPDEREGASAGFPLIGLFLDTPGLGGSGTPFYDGGADALSFFLSTPDQPYEPLPSRSSGTSHAAKQRRRVQARLNAAHNPLWRMLDRRAVGIAGHSYGAQAASWLAQHDQRLKAAVAWDTLCVPVSPSPDEAESIGGDPGNRVGGAVPVGPAYGFAPECFGAPPGPAPRLTKPALGLSGDYLLSYAPYVTKPDPRAKTRASAAYSKARVDSGQIVIRGGTHYEFNDEPLGAVPASLRGIDLTSWYTTAWFDKYLKRDPTADARLLSARWRDDRAGRAVDPSDDGNLFSYHYRSRLDVTLAGGDRVACEDLRTGCPRQPHADTDCGVRDYSFLAAATKAQPVATCRPCASRVAIARRGVRVSRRALSIRGRASVRCEQGATVARPAVRRVDLAVARATGRRCAFLTARRRLTRPRDCRRFVTLRARGTTTWRFSTMARFPRGRYRVYAFATDQDRHRARNPARPHARFLVR